MVPSPRLNGRASSGGFPAALCAATLFIGTAIGVAGGYALGRRPSPTASPASPTPTPLGQAMLTSGPSLSAPATAASSGGATGSTIIPAIGSTDLTVKQDSAPVSLAEQGLVVLNGTKVRGLAKKCQFELQVSGIAPGKTGNFRPVPQPVTFLRYGSTTQALAESARKALGGTVPMTPYPNGEDGPATLILGGDYLNYRLFQNVPLTSAPSTTKAAASTGAAGGF